MTSTQKKMLRYGRDENWPTCLFTLLDPSTYVQELKQLY
jgi:hypothetical protein